MAIAIDIQRLVKTFPNPSGPGSGGGLARAVDDVSLRIEPGELFFLLGPSGCGKTTLLRMIAGFIEPDSGAILFDGRDITNLPPNKRNTGMVFQSYALWPHMSVEQNVAFGLSVRKVPAEESARRVREALSAVRMEEYAKRKPNQLSGGQQQRVALARALVVRPDVLLLDEPLSNLDAKLRIELRSEIRRICKQAGITGVYVTHDQKEALSMADRVAIMRQGRVIQLGTPRELYARPGSRFVAEFLGETNFIEGQIVEIKPGGDGAAGVGSTIRTSAGELRAGAPVDASLGVGAKVLCSIRPEALHLVEGGAGLGAPATNTLRGTIKDSVYLGEMAQHTIELPGGTSVRAAELNPMHLAPGAGASAASTPITLAVRAQDVVVIPAQA